MILLIDNYDSFVFNLARYLDELGVPAQVVRNDAISVLAIRQLAPEAIVISPGPCGPDEAGVSLAVVKGLRGEIPILGVCLGHQVIAAAYGGRVIRASQPVHGKSSLIHHSDHALFAGLPNPLQAGRYHSLVADRDSLPQSLNVIAETADGLVMGMAHQTDRVYGVQFHPESILTIGGHRLLANFLALSGMPTRTLPSVRQAELVDRPAVEEPATQGALFW